jgi:hypothetical protein
VTVFSPATRSAAIKGAVAIVLDEHRDATDLATRITTAVTEALAELEAAADEGAYGVCAECRQLYMPEPHNRTGFCSWDCFDVKERPNAPEAFLAFLPASTRMTRIVSEDDQ